MLVQLAQVEEVVDAAQQMILRDVALKIEGVEQALLSLCFLPHHHRTPASTCYKHTAPRPGQQQKFFKCKGLPRPEATLELRGIECQD